MSDMAFKAKYAFATITLIQFIVFAIYLTGRDRLQYLATAGHTYTEIFLSTDRTALSSTSRTTILPGKITERLSTSDDSRYEVFQTINNTRSLVYSAFYDYLAAREGRPLVRVMGLMAKGVPLTVFCNCSVNNTSVMSTGNFAAFSYAHGFDEVPASFECKLPKDVRPTHLSVTFNATDIPTNRLQVIYPGDRIRNITVCYSLLHSRFNRPLQLIENIEMNRLLGVDHFVIYNMSISQSVDEVLRLYQDDGIVTVHQWPLPTNKAGYFAQMTLLNDCFYRNRNVSRFVVIMDTDEFFVPRHHSTLMELIHNVSSHEADVSKFMNPSNSSSHGQNLTACFMMRSSFFSNDKTPDWGSLPQQFPFSEEEKKNVVKYKMSTLTQFVRQQNIFPHRVRSKYIARPELIYTSGVHIVMKYTKSNTCVHINETIALVHHYRVGKMQKDIVNDTSILHFKQKLYPRIMEQIKRFPKIFT